MLKPVHTRSVGGDIVNQILDLIRSGVLEVGDALPSERALATELQVSRPTVRQALERLINIGVIQNGTGRQGYSQVVSQWVPGEALNASVEVMNEDHVFRLLEARRTVEPRVAQLAALRATSDDFRQLQESIDLLAENYEDLVRASQAELLFHRKMWRAARNEALEKMMVGLSRDLGTMHDLMLRTPADYAAGIELHQQTLSALRKGDPDTIEAVMLHHLGHFEQIVEEVYGRSAARQTPDFLRS